MYLDSIKSSLLVVHFAKEDNKEAYEKVSFLKKWNFASLHFYTNFWKWWKKDETQYKALKNTIFYVQQDEGAAVNCDLSAATRSYKVVVCDQHNTQPLKLTFLFMNEGK